MRRLLAAPFLALVLAACGSDGSSPSATSEESPREAVLAAATSTADAGSYRSSFDLTFEGLGDEPVSMTGEGVFSPRDERGRMTFDMSELGAAAGQQLGEAQFVFQGDTIFMRFPAVAERLPDVKPWIRFDLSDLAGQLGTDLGELSQLNQSDPSAALEYLKAASGEIQEAGEEEVRGEPTTHYRLTIDLRKVAAGSPGQRANVEKLLRVSGIEMVPAEVWVDGDGRVRRLVLDYRGVKAAGAGEIDMTMTMELYDFGVGVDAKPPPASQVTDIQDIVGRGAAETKHTEPEGA